MHYRNGREAKNGDKIVKLDEKGNVVSFGVLHSAVPGNDYCNGYIATVQSPTDGACMVDCLHKGHDFITEMQTESFSVNRKFDFDANTLNLPWALGWVLGSVSTSGSAAAGYTHTFKMSDPVATGRQNPVTSIHHGHQHRGRRHPEIRVGVRSVLRHRQRRPVCGEREKRHRRASINDQLGNDHS